MWIAIIISTVVLTSIWVMYQLNQNKKPLTIYGKDKTPSRIGNCQIYDSADVYFDVAESLEE